MLVPPYAWYRAISPLWDTPVWIEEARDKVETVAYVILHGQSSDPKLRTEMAERIPALQRLYKKQPKEFRAELNESVTAFIDLVDIIAHDAVDEIIRTGSLTVEKKSIVRSHPTLYNLVTRFEGLRAALDATMLDAQYMRSMFSLDDLKSIPAEKRLSILEQADSGLERWKEGALQTKVRIMN